jgi:HEAT repeat protein
MRNSVWIVVCALPLVLFVARAQNEESYSTKQRISRIRQLANSNAQSIPTLANYLSDPDRQIRIETVKAIVKLGTGNSIEPLIKATRDNDAEVQIRATDGLVNFYLPGYVAKGALSGPITRGFRQVRSFFASRNDEEIAADITIRPDVAEALGEEIAHASSMEARANAALAAGILRAKPAVPALTQALRSKDSDLIFESLVALQKINDPSAGPGVSFLARDLDDRVQTTALETIGVLHSVSSAPDVRSALMKARNTKIRRAALQALAMLGQAEDRHIFKDYATDSDAALRASALEGLGRIREPEDYPALEAAYNESNSDWKIHLAAAFALVSEGKLDTGEFSPLRYLLENLNIKNRAYAGTAYLTELCRRDDVRKAVIPLTRDATVDQK